MLRNLRDRGWLETKGILRYGITSGRALEVGTGPGYLGLEWLKRTQQTELTGLEVSAAMIAVAERNAREYGLQLRARYIGGNALAMPFAEETFDAVFSNGSLHEWEDPRRVFREIHRVLKPGGCFFVSDLRRNMGVLLRWFLKASTRPRSIVAGLESSINASYAPEEITGILQETPLRSAAVRTSPLGVEITGFKPQAA